jgi:hypothetical protein
MKSHIASPHLLPGNSYKHLDDARVGKGHVTASAVTKQLKRFPRVRSRIYRRDKLVYESVLGSRQLRKFRSWRSDCVN